MKLVPHLAAGLLALLLPGLLRAADRVSLKDGSIIVGKLLAVEGGKFRIETGFVGVIEIAQDKIQGFATDEPVQVGLAAGHPVLGKVEPAECGIRILTPNGPVPSETGAVAALWRQGSDSPEVRQAKAAAARKVRHWAYEASVAVAGRSGASEKFGANLGFKATLASAVEKLVLTFAEERAQDNGVPTADRQFAGVDYSAFYSPDNGWYARTSLERDVIKALDLRSSSAVGSGRKLIKNKAQDLEFRVGLNYLYEGYSNGTSFTSPGLDLAILHAYQFSNSKLVNSLSYTPAFKEFSNYRVRHESSLELPLGAARWKLKFGVANDYNSKPPAGTVRLDTTYFTSLLLNWH